MNKKPTTTIRAAISFSALVALAAIAQETRPAPDATPLATPLPALVEPAAPTPTPASAAVEETKIAADPALAAEQLSVNEPTLGSTPAYPEIVSDNTALHKKQPFAAQPPSPVNGITLDQAIDIALQKNADILKQLAEIKRTRGVVVEIRAEVLPTLSASSSYNQTDPNQTNRGSRSSSSTTTTTGTAFIDGQTVPATFDLLGNSVTGTAQLPGQTVPVSIQTTSNNTTVSSVSDKSWRLSFQVQQTLYSGGRVTASIRAARIQEDAAFYQLRDTIDQVIASVRTQFYTVLLNRALIEVAKESVDLLQSQLKDQQNRFEAGTVPRFNVLRAEVELANAQPELIRAKNNYRTAQLTLAKLVGVSWPTTSDLTPYPIKGMLVYTPRKIDLGVAVETAKARRAFLKIQRQTILAEVQQIKIAYAGYKPTITGDIGWEFRNDPSSDDFESQVDGWFFGFSGNWNIFDGLATSGKIQQAKARLESAKVNYEDSVRQVELEVQTTYSKLQESRELIDSQQKTVEQAQESLRLATERLSAGAGTQLDVLDARVSLTEAQTTALQALADYNSTLAEFDRVTGVDTVYDDTFDDPLTNKETRKHWYSKKRKARQTLTDAEIQAALVKRRKESQGD